MSFQIEVLKVLASHPSRGATVDAIKRDLAALASREWSERIRALAKTAGKVDAFSSGYIVRTAGHWRLTDAGLEFLTRLEGGALSGALMAHSEPDLIEDFDIALADRPQRPFSQHRPETMSERRSIMRRARQFAGNWLGYKSG